MSRLCCIAKAVNVNTTLDPVIYVFFQLSNLLCLLKQDQFVKIIRKGHGQSAKTKMPKYFCPGAETKDYYPSMI